MGKKVELETSNDRIVGFGFGFANGSKLTCRLITVVKTGVGTILKKICCGTETL